MGTCSPMKILASVLSMVVICGLASTSPWRLETRLATATARFPFKSPKANWVVAPATPPTMEPAVALLPDDPLELELDEEDDCALWFEVPTMEKSLAVVG